jgi:subtilisin
LVELSSGITVFAIILILLISTTVLLFVPEHSMAQTIPPQATITINSSLEMPTNVTKTRIENESTGIDRVSNLFYSDIGIPKTKVNADVDVAIIGSGIDIDHPDLNVYKHINLETRGFNMSHQNNRDIPNLNLNKLFPPFKPEIGPNPARTDDDNCGQGTRVAGVIGAKYNGIGAIGIAPGARLWSIKVLDLNSTTGRCEGSVSSVIAGVEYVTSKASQIDVVVIPLGMRANSTALDDAIERAVAAGVTIVVAAGNSNVDASSFSPANHKDVITVSAISDFDGKCGGHSTARWVSAGEFTGLYDDDNFKI